MLIQLIILIIPFIIMYNLRYFILGLKGYLPYLLIHVPGFWGVVYFLYFNHVYCKHSIAMYAEYEQGIPGMAIFTTVFDSPLLLAIIYYLFLAAMFNIIGSVLMNVQVFYNYIDFFIGLIVCGILYKIARVIYDIVSANERSSLIFGIVCLIICLLDAIFWICCSLSYTLGNFVSTTAIRYTVCDFIDRLPCKKRGLSAKEVDEKWLENFAYATNIEKTLHGMISDLSEARYVPRFAKEEYRMTEDDLYYIESSLNTVFYQHRKHANTVFRRLDPSAVAKELINIESELNRLKPAVSHLSALSRENDPEILYKQKRERERQEQEREREQEDQKRKEQERQSEERKREEQRRREQQRREYEKKKKEQRKKAQQKESFASGNMFFEGCKDFETLTARYKKLVKIYHPDSGIGSSEAFKKLQDEYENLKKQMS